LKGWKIGKLILTTCYQGSGAPFIDKAFITDSEKNHYEGYAVLLNPWKRNRYGESLIQKAFVFGYIRQKMKLNKDRVDKRHRDYLTN